MTRIICPKCKSINIRTYSRKKYVRWLAICVVLTGFFYWWISDLIAKHDLNFIVFFGLVIAGIGISSALITGLYASTKLLLIKQTSYKCQHCKSKFAEGLQVEYTSPNIEDH